MNFCGDNSYHKLYKEIDIVEGMEKALASLGLTETESKVYLALLKRGASPVGRLAKETGVHRRTVYDAVERLIEKGMISYITNNGKRYFEAVNPEKLIEIVKEREENIEKALPELLGLYKSNKDKKETLFYRGKQGLKFLFEDMINSKIILQIGKEIDVEERFGLLFKRFHNQIKNKKIQLKIVNEKKIKDLEKTKVTTYIYGKNIAIVLWSREPFVILIRQEEIAEAYKIYFENLN